MISCHYIVDITCMARIMLRSSRKIFWPCSIVCRLCMVSCHVCRPNSITYKSLSVVPFIEVVSSFDFVTIFVQINLGSADLFLDCLPHRFGQVPREVGRTFPRFVRQLPRGPRGWRFQLSASWSWHQASPGRRSDVH